MSLPWHQTDNAHKFKLEEPGSVHQAAGWQIVYLAFSVCVQLELKLVVSIVAFMF